MKIKLLVLLILIGGFVGAKAQAETRCNVDAFHETGRDGLNIRSGAGTNFKVVKSLPALLRDFYVFDIVESKNGWFRFNRVTVSKKKTVFQGDAWVFGKFLSVAISHDFEAQKLTVYSAPNKNSKKRTFEQLPEVYEFKDCEGDWVKIGSSKSETPVLINGWLEKSSHCGNYLYCSGDN